MATEFLLRYSYSSLTIHTPCNTIIIFIPFSDVKGIIFTQSLSGIENKTKQEQCALMLHLLKTSFICTSYHEITGFVICVIPHL